MVLLGIDELSKIAEEGGIWGTLTSVDELICDWEK
jgi:hypothetical protein